jgi:hypothetical protein
MKLKLNINIDINIINNHFKKKDISLPFLNIKVKMWFFKHKNVLAIL